jgi:hypothetical protein
MLDNEKSVFKGKIAMQEFEGHATDGIPGQEDARSER